MSKPVIVAVVGPSGCGKSTLAEHLKEKFGWNVIVSYTTRPMRDDETDGANHWFVKESEMPPKSAMLAYTRFGGHHYWATHQQLSTERPSVYVIDEKGLLRMMDEFDEVYEILPVLVKRDIKLLRQEVEEERLLRDRNRVHIEERAYYGVIENNGTLEEFFSNADKVIGELL